MFASHFSSKMDANRFQTLSEETVHTPTVIDRYKNICLLEPTYKQFSEDDKRIQANTWSNIVSVLNCAAEHNIYHLNINTSLFAYDTINRNWVITNWETAYFHPDDNDYNITHSPSNLETVLEAPTEDNLYAAVISQLGYILWCENLLDTKYVYTNPEECTFEQIQEYL